MRDSNFDYTSLENYRLDSRNVLPMLYHNIFASAPKPTNQKQYELNCQAFFWLIFKLIGEFLLCEVQNGKGRSDAVVWEKNVMGISKN